MFSKGWGEETGVLLIPGLFYFQVLPHQPGTAWCGVWPSSGLEWVGWPLSSAAWRRGWSPPASRGARTLGGSGATRSVSFVCMGRIVLGFVPSHRCPVPEAKRWPCPQGAALSQGTGLPQAPQWRRRWREQKPWSRGASPGLLLVLED